MVHLKKEFAQSSFFPFWVDINDLNDPTGFFFRASKRQNSLSRVLACMSVMPFKRTETLWIFHDVNNAPHMTLEPPKLTRLLSKDEQTRLCNCYMPFKNVPYIKSMNCLIIKCI